MEDNVTESDVDETINGKKPVQSGIIYLSSVPTRMNVSILRRYFENFGEVGRIFLQPDNKAKSKGKRSRVFSEGWVEFRNKKIAKKVAANLNSTQIGGKKKSKWREELWNIKYLHRFKWAHLNERLAYEKAVHSQRMRTEIAQAKREANFYIQNAERNEKQKQMEKRQKKKKLKEPKEGNKSEEATANEAKESNENERVNVIKLKETDDEIVNKRKLHADTMTDFKKKKAKVGSSDSASNDSGKRKAFLAKIFSAGNGSDDETNN